MIIDDYQYLAHEPSAEQLIDAVVAHGTVPLFATSRSRPSWVYAKRLLYGEVAEFGRNILAMTHEEAARAVPPKTDPGPAGPSRSQKAGGRDRTSFTYPVSEAGGRRRDSQALHSYFAEELYQELVLNFNGTSFSSRSQQQWTSSSRNCSLVQTDGRSRRSV